MNASPYTNDIIHAVVVGIVVVCATVLTGLHSLDRNTVGNVYLAAVGYAAGRAGSAIARRAGDYRNGGNGGGQ